MADGSGSLGGRCSCSGQELEYEEALTLSAAALKTLESGTEESDASGMGLGVDLGFSLCLSLSGGNGGDKRRSNGYGRQRRQTRHMALEMDALRELRAGGGGSGSKGGCVICDGEGEGGSRCSDSVQFMGGEQGSKSD